MMRVAFRILAAAFCLGLAALSATYLGDDLATLGTRETAQRLNLLEPVTPALIETLATGPEFASSLMQCRSDILNAALVIQLNNLDNINRASDDTRWQEAMGRAQDLVAHTVRCTPADGDLWLRDAMMVHSVAEVPEAIAARLALSSNLTPTYMPVVQARVALWAAASSATQAAGKNAMESDLRTMVFYFPPYQTAAILKSLPDPVKSQALSFLPLAPVEHRERLMTALSRR